MQLILLDSNLTTGTHPMLLVLELAAIIALAGLAFWWTARLKQRLLGLGPRHHRHRKIEVVETTFVAPRRALLLVRIGDGLRLLSSSETGIADLGPVSESAAPLPLAAETRS